MKKKLTTRQSRALEVLKSRPFVFWRRARKPVGLSGGYPMNVLEQLVEKGYATQTENDTEVSSSSMGLFTGTINFDSKVEFKAIEDT